MENFFESVFPSTGVTPATYFMMAGIALLCGILFSFIMSFKVRAHKRFFLVNAILPVTIGTVICFVNGNIGAGIAVGGAFALVRFRSAQGTADEIAAILITMASGIAFGMGYLAYGAIGLIALALIYVGLTYLPIFNHAALESEKLLKVTVPESLDYSGIFDDTFAHFTKNAELVETKTVNMGSMFRLSYNVKLKNPKEEKEFIDEIRIKNANLEISLLPYTEDAKNL